MRFMQAETPCKICGKPAIAKWEDGVEQEIVDKFMPMVTHDRCADQRRALADAEDFVFRLAFKFESQGETMKPEVRAKVREALIKATHRYAAAFGATINRQINNLGTDLADLLIEQPDKAGRILYKFRAQVQRTPVAQQQAAEVEPDEFPENVEQGETLL